MSGSTNIKSLKCGDLVLSVSMHSGSNILATGLANGEVDIWNLNKNGRKDDSDDIVMVDNVVKSNKYDCVAKVRNLNDVGNLSCRVVEYFRPFTQTDAVETSIGDRIAIGYNHGQLQVCDSNGQILWNALKAHDKCGLTCASWLSDSTLVSGDENGTIKIWDTRIGGTRNVPMHSVKKQEDYISGISFYRNTLLSSSGDGSLAAFDFRFTNAEDNHAAEKTEANKNPKLRFKQLSEKQEVDILGVLVMCNGKKVVTGSLDGTLDIWSWGKWEDISDRMLGHLESVSSMIKVDETTLITGSADGLVRVVGLFPHKLLGVLEDFGEYNPIEKMSWSYDKKLVACCMHDSYVRFCDSSVLMESDDIVEESDTEHAEKDSQEASNAHINNDSADDESSFYSEKDNKKKRHKGKRKLKLGHQKRRNASMFFSDL